MTTVPADAAARLLHVVEAMREETRVQRGPSATLQSHLERDLGLDSLARVELFHRVEDAFGVRLREEIMVAAETPADLLRALETAGVAAAGAAPAIAEIGAHEEVKGLPDAATTLLEVLEWHVQAHAERKHILFTRDATDTEPLTYAALQKRAQAVAAGLHSRGLEHGQAVGIMLPTCLEFFYSYYGILLAGGIPVPLYPPATGGSSRCNPGISQQAEIGRASCRERV